MIDHENENKHIENKSVFHKIFVHNIGWKIFSVVSSAIIWFLVAGLM